MGIVSQSMLFTGKTHGFDFITAMQKGVMTVTLEWWVASVCGQKPPPHKYFTVYALYFKSFNVKESMEVYYVCML